jgi:uncharacterized protein (DUF849 family)
MLIKAAINGGRTRAEHSAIPISPDEQAADVIACLNAGAGAIHLHVRSTARDEGAASEKESLNAEDVARTLKAVRSVWETAQIPQNNVIGVSTGAWILPDTNQRLQAISAWEVLPDFASVNFIEEGAVELASLLLSRGVDVEAGLSDAGAAEVFLKSGLTTRCIRVLLEPQEQEMEQALETVSAIEKLLNKGLAEVSPLPPLLLHGTDATAWLMMDVAFSRGYDVRIGLEDTLLMPGGRPAQANVELVAEAMRRVMSDERLQ